MDKDVSYRMSIRPSEHFVLIVLSKVISMCRGNGLSNLVGYMDMVRLVVHKKHMHRAIASILNRR